MTVRRQEAEHLVRKAHDAEETMLPGGDICVKPSREASLRRARELAGSDGIQNKKGWWCFPLSAAAEGGGTLRERLVTSVSTQVERRADSLIDTLGEPPTTLSSG